MSWYDYRNPDAIIFSPGEPVVFSKPHKNLRSARLHLPLYPGCIYLHIFFQRRWEEQPKLERLYSRELDESLWRSSGLYCCGQFTSDWFDIYHCGDSSGDDDCVCAWPT
jgi:hypothetical protein